MENTKRKRHFLPCPNCLDNLLYKSSRSIPFLQRGIVISLVQACSNCLSDPGGLDEEKMVATLMTEEWGKWPEDAARKAARAIIEEARKKAIPIEPAPVEKILTTTIVAV